MTTKPQLGQDFTDATPDEFARINKAANILGLMSTITAIREDDDGEKLISFRLTLRFDA